MLGVVCATDWLTLVLQMGMYSVQVYMFGNNCVSEKEWDQHFQLYVKKSSRKTCAHGCRDTG